MLLGRRRRREQDAKLEQEWAQQRSDQQWEDALERLLDRVDDLARESLRDAKREADALGLTVGEVGIPSGRLDVEYRYNVRPAP